MEETLDLAQQESLQPPRPVGSFYLRFQDEQAFLAACEQAGFIKEQVVEWETTVETKTLETPEGEQTFEQEVRIPKTYEKVFTTQCHEYTLDIIGIIWQAPVLEMDEQTGEMVELQEALQKEGFHVNYSGILPESFDACVLEPPNNPVRLLSQYAKEIISEVQDPGLV